MTGLMLGRMAMAAMLLAGAHPAAAADRDWGETLRRDAQALHDDVAANHPGPVNPDDPEFALRNDAELKRALARSRAARSYGDYYFALREYVASFDDGHFSFGASGATPNTDRWPGFLTRDDGSGRPRVFTRADDAPVPLGAELLACDGRSAARFAAETLGRSWGRWTLEAQRVAFSPFLLVDQGNRYVTMPKRCTFLVDGRRRAVELAWRPLPFGEFGKRVFAESVVARPEFAARVLAEGTRWFTIPSFHGDPRSDAGKALPGLIARMQSDLGALETAPAIVLDVRRNGGGSSEWSDQIAEVLWGRAAIARRPQTRMQILWRASPTNLAQLEKVYAERRAGTSPATTRFFEGAIAGISGAIARREPLWDHNGEDAEPSTPPAATTPPPDPTQSRGRVYVVTDAGCSSACLDALDLWRALGAVHVGRTTSADTLYMEARFYRLPSGLTAGVMPMKVYRGRRRGSNEPLVPRYRFDGDIADTPALERWIAQLPRR